MQRLTVQRRLPPPVIALLTAFGMYLIARAFPPAQAMPLIQHVLALAIAACALLIDIAALWSFQRHKTTVNPLRPEKARLIISNGIYSFSRNPMYLGMLLWLFALKIIYLLFLQCLFYNTYIFSIIMNVFVYCNSVFTFQMRYYNVSVARTLVNNMHDVCGDGLVRPLISKAAILP